MNTIVKALLVGITSVSLLAGCSVGSLMMEEKSSPYGFEQTVSTIMDNAKSRGWVTPKVYDFQKTMLKLLLALGTSTDAQSQ